jgi:rod shape-determining protein MreD
MRRIDREPLPGEAIAATPALTVACAILVMALPLPLGPASIPDLPLLMVLAWAVVQPRLLPGWVAFFLGLLQDAVSGLPLGVMAVALPVARLLPDLLGIRSGTRSLGAEWLAAAGVIIAAMLVEAGALWLAGRAVRFLPIALQAGLSILFFPVALAIAAQIGRRLARG